MPDNNTPQAAAPQPIDTAPKNGGWILGRIPVDQDKSWQQPWIILTWGDSGWMDDEGYTPKEVIEWVALPDPQPAPTGWTPPSGTIRLQEITGEGWTCNGQPIDVPWRWKVYIEKPDGSYDEYRDAFLEATFEAAQAQAVRWRDKFGLPIETVSLDQKVVSILPAVTLQ